MFMYSTAIESMSQYNPVPCLMPWAMVLDMKWEDKLLGRKFTLVTDHKGLEYFETQKNLLDRQVWWWEFLSRFNYTIMHVDGMDNKVVDCLSCYYENDTSEDNHSENTYVKSLQTHIEETMDLRAIVKNAYRKDTIQYVRK